MEGGGKARGYAALVGRDPSLGIGHITPIAAFRADIGEGAKDVVFKAFKESPVGESALKTLREAAGGRSISSFEDIANLSSRGKIGSAKMSFFRQMAQNISSYMGEGEGKVYFQDVFVEVHYTSGHKHLANMSVAKQMVGDMDSDFYKVIPISEKRKGAMMKEAATRLQNNFLDQAYAAQTEQYFEEAKQTVQAIRSGEAGADLSKAEAAAAHSEAVFQTSLKIAQAKEVGPLNTALDTLRLGLVHTLKSPEEVRHADRAFALLTVVQEAGGVGRAKGTNLGSLLTRAAWQGIRGGGDKASTAQWNMILGDIFPSFKAGGGFGEVTEIRYLDTIPGISESAEYRDAVEKAIRSAGKDNSQDVRGIIERAMATANELKLENVTTERRLQNMATWGTKDWMKLTRSDSLQMALREGGAEGFFKEAEGVMARASATGERIAGAASKRMIGPLALGAVASVFLGSALGGEGYSSSQMTMPGEFSDAKVNAAIASGNLFSQEYGGGPSADSIQPDPRTNLMGRPINMQEAYFARNNAWRISGEVPSTTGLGDLSAMISKMGGSSSVRINDTRRPITPNYIDRLQGD